MIEPRPAWNRDHSASFAWTPGPVELQRSRLARLIEVAGLTSLDEFRRRSATDPAWFWEQMTRDIGVVWKSPPSRTLDLSRGREFATFFPDAGFNYTEQALDHWIANGRADHPAIVWEGEEGSTRTLTYRQLHAEVSKASHGLAALGVRHGDRVGIFMPLIVECAVAMLACSRLGAIFTPIFSGFGASAVATRLNDCDASVVITVDGAYRRGKAVSLKAIADEAVMLSPCVRRVVVAQRLTGRDHGATPWDESRDIWWHDVLAGQPVSHKAAPTLANDPYMVIYTSGTTGQPKGTRHIHAGFPVKSAADQIVLFDVQTDDRVCWYSDPGWMMAPWLIKGPLLLGATVCLYDGAPDWPDAGRLWEYIAKHRVSVFGIAPTAIRSLMRHGSDLVSCHDRSSLRVLGSSGEPWTPEAWWWFFSEVGQGRCPIINYSGGTEISGGIVGCTTIEPQQPCGFTGAVPGMSVDVIDQEGKPVRGTVGELVVTQPWVGMTQSFWGGPPPGHPEHSPARQAAADRRYLDTYWTRPDQPEMWVHGDWAQITPDGSWYILGRSDDTIKVAGKRLGPAEVEASVLTHPEILEAAACGLPDDLKGEVLAVVAVPRNAKDANDPDRVTRLATEIAEIVVRDLGKTLRPNPVLIVAELPKTKSGKVMRRVVRAVLAADPDFGDLSGLDNPSAIDLLKAGMTAMT